MGISFFVSKKYFFSKSKFNIVNFISLIASFVLVIASCSFFIVLSVFSGLKDFGLKYNKAFDPDIKISSSSLSSFVPTESQLNWLSSNNDSFLYSKVLEEKAKKKGYSSSFIVAFKNGKKIPLTEALKTTAN